MNTDRYKTPAGDGEVVVIPEPEALPDLARANAELRASYDFRILDVPAATLAAQAREEFLGPARRYTESLGVAPCDNGAGMIVATGHQPEFAHPGIWLKNHLAARAADRLGGTGLNFIVDNDAVDLSRIRTPALEEGELRVRDVPFIECPPDTAAEEVAAPEGAADALAEAARLAGPALGETLAGEFAAAAEPDHALASFVSRPRRRIEETFGVHNLELPVSSLAGTGAFRAYCAHIIANAGRFAEVCNRTLDRHRAEHGISNPVEPSPNLRIEPGRVELPFWVWRPGEARRPLAVVIDGEARVLYCGSDQAARFSGDEPAAGALGRASLRFRIRPRALAMTMFFRLFCCDLFIHGMGGARYEPVNDGVIREFFGVEPPRWAAASATLRVKPATPPPQADTDELRQRVHRMKTTPERFVGEFIPADAEASDLARRRAELLDLSGLSKRERRRAFDESKRIAARLQERLAPHILAAEKKLGRAEERRGLREAIEDRGFPFFLHSRAALEKLYGA